MNQPTLGIQVDKRKTRPLMERLKAGMWLPRHRNRSTVYHIGDIKRLVLMDIGYAEVAGKVRIDEIKSDISTPPSRFL